MSTIASEKRWQEESDASTLAQAEVILNDPERLAAAKRAAKRLAQQQEKEAEAMTRIASGKGPRQGQAEIPFNEVISGKTSPVGVDVFGTVKNK